MDSKDCTMLLTHCWQHALVTGGAPRFDAFTNLIPGVYDVNYNVVDGCGNVVECNGTITVIPKDPTPYCISLSSAVMKDGRVEL